MIYSLKIKIIIKQNNIMNKTVNEKVIFNYLLTNNVINITVNEKVRFNYLLTKN